MKKASKTTPNLRLKAAREARGWSQKYVAEQIDADHYYLSRWESGTSFPSPHYRSKLCILFGADARELGLLPNAGRNKLRPYGEDGERDEDAEAAAERAIDKHVLEVLDPAIPTPLLHVADIVGRNDLLTSLRERLSIGKGLVLTALNGLPGVGKTTLAVALAHDEEVRTHFPNGMLWAGLGPRPNVLEHLSRWGTLLGISAQESAELLSAEAWIRAIHTIIAGRKMLLVIDDAWDINDALSFKIGGPDCAYLVTTRYPHLALQFSADGTTMVEELSEEQGVLLLTHLAPAIASSDPAVVRELVRAVGGLPLALTLIGKYLRTQTYSGQPRRVRAAIERLRNVEERLRLSEPRALLEHLPGLAPATPISLHVVIEISEQPLGTQAHDALRALSVFPAKPNSFSEEAALAVAAVPAEVLDELTDAGLLEGRGPGRYTLHQIIADYALTHLSDTGAYQRLVEYFSDFVKEHEMDYHLLELETGNIFAALEAAARHQLHTQFVSCTHDFTHFLEARGLNAQAEEYLQRAEQVALAANDLTGLASIYRKLGRIVGKRGDHAQEESYLKQALAIARQIDHREHMCIILKSLGAMAGERGDYAQAEVYLQEGLTLAREIDYREQMGVLLLNLGQVASERGAFALAEKHLLEGLLVARQVGYPEQISLLLSNLGVLAGRQENYAQAEVYLQEGLALARQIGYKERIGLVLVNLGWVVSAMGRYEQGDIYMQEALELAQQSGNHWLISGILGEQGESYLTRQIFDKARAAFQEMLAIETGGANQRAIGEALYGLARVAAAQDDMVEARRLGEESAGILEKIGHLTAPEVKQWLAQNVLNA